MDALTWLFTLSSALLTLLSIPLAFNRIPPNLFYGVRVRATLRNPDLWYAVNRYAGRRLAVVGLVSAAAALIWRAIPGMSTDGYALLAGTFIVTGLIGVTIQSFLYLASLTRTQS